MSVLKQHHQRKVDTLFLGVTATVHIARDRQASTWHFFLFKLVTEEEQLDSVVRLLSQKQLDWFVLDTGCIPVTGLSLCFCVVEY